MQGKHIELQVIVMNHYKSPNTYSHCSQNLLRGISEPGEIGFLSLFEHYGNCIVSVANTMYVQFTSFLWDSAELACINCHEVYIQLSM